MLKGKTLFAGLLAGSLLSAAASVWAGDLDGYVIDSTGKPVITQKNADGSGGCLLDGPQHRTGDMVECGVDGDDDGDGVKNSKDKCPNTPKGTPVDEDGCPIKTAEPTKEDTQAPVVDTIYRANLSDAVLFDFDKSTLKASGVQVLDALAVKVAQEGAKVVLVNVTGHADRIGTDAYNIALSQRRANTVANYLKSKNVVAADKIKVIAKGESEATGKTAAERAKDRKVVVDIHVSK